MQSASDGRPEVWPVIHLQSPTQGIDNARLAAACGCQGVFLISMHGDDGMIDPVADGIKARLPNLKVGVNYLTMPADVAIARSLEGGHHATWADDAGIRSDGNSPLPRRCAALLKGREDHLFFAGVAFKYLREDPDPPRAARIASDLNFVPTTTGVGTGSAPDISKLAGIRDELGLDGPLAVASGITPENVAALGPYLSHILVATGILRKLQRGEALAAGAREDFNPELLAALMRNRPVRLGRTRPDTDSPETAGGSP